MLAKLIKYFLSMCFLLLLILKNHLYVNKFYEIVICKA